MKRTLGTLVLAALLICSAASSANAQRRDFAAGGVSQLGGQTLQGRNALATGGLYPGLWFQFTMGLSPRFDLGFRGDLNYASPLETTYGPNFVFSLPMRLSIAHGQKVSVALKLAPSFLAGEMEDDEFKGQYCHAVGPTGWHCHRGLNGFYGDAADSDFGMGFGFEFGVLVGIPVKIVNIIFGLTTPFAIVFFEDHDGADIYIPFAGFGGAEIRVGERLNVFGLIQPGMSVHTTTYGTEMEGFFRFWGGIEYAL